MAPDEDCDHTGFELPLTPPDAPADPEQGDLSGADCFRPDAADCEPIFRPDGGGQAFPADDCLQPGVPDCAD